MTDELTVAGHRWAVGAGLHSRGCPVRKALERFLVHAVSAHGRHRSPFLIVSVNVWNRNTYDLSNIADHLPDVVWAWWIALHLVRVITCYLDLTVKRARLSAQTLGTWGTPASLVAEWAGHSVEVLLLI